MSGRFRSRGELVIPSGTAWTYWNFPVSCTNRVQSATTNRSYSVFRGVKRSTWDYVTPDFWKRSRRGEFIISPFSSVLVSYESKGITNMVYTAKVKTCSGPDLYGWFQNIGSLLTDGYLVINHSTTIPAVPCISTDRTVSLTAEVVTRCLAQRQSGETNYSESLAELDKAWSMMLDPLQNVRVFQENYSRERQMRYKALLKRLRPRGGKTKRMRMAKDRPRLLAEFLSAEWLRYRYGITPIVNDVKAALKVLQKSYIGKPKRYSSRASGTATDSKITALSYVSASENLSYQRSDTQSFSVRAVWTDEYTRTAFDELGLTFHNVVGLAWELTRLSFVYDWFVNVGDLIYANIPRINVTKLGGTYTVKDEIISTYAATGYTHVSYTVSGFPSDTFTSTRKETTRTLISDTAGQLVIRDDFRLDSYNRCADSIALILAQFKSLRLSA